MSVNFADKKLIKIYVAIAVLISAFIAPRFFDYPYVKEVLFVVSWLISGFSVFKNCIASIKLKEFFDENLLMTLATFGAICIGNFSEAVSVMILYNIGEFLQDCAIDKSRKSISELINITPDFANVEREGRIFKVKPADVMPGETIIVKPGEKIPLDSVVEAGTSSIDVSSLTGESVPRDVKPNDYLLSGCINLNGILKLRVDRYYTECAVSKLMDLIENAKRYKSKTEKFITKFARIYTPIVLFIALIITIYPVMTILVNENFVFNWAEIKGYIERALTFLVISCPCAFIISVPLTFFSGIGVASKMGVLIKGENHLETLAHVNLVAFDKTGTITKGNHKVTRIFPAAGITREELADTILKVESGSIHPIAVAMRNAFGQKQNGTIANYNVTEIAGKGIWSFQGETEILVGNKELMNDYGIGIFEPKQAGIKVYAAKNKKYLGCVVIADEVKQSAKIVISQLKRIGIKSVMLTGDIKDNARSVAKFVGLDEWYAGLMPEDKVHKMETLVKDNKVMYVGDGINDAAVIMRSDVGVAMGAIGSDAAIEAADIVITDDNLAKLYLSICIARNTIKVAKENIWIAIGVKALFLSLGALGIMKMWAAIFADTGVTLIAIINALKILQISNKKLN